MSATARLSKIKLRTTPRRIARAWIRWAHENHLKPCPSPLLELLREMELEIRCTDFEKDRRTRSGQSLARHDETIAQAARFQCFFLIDVYAQAFCFLGESLDAAFRLAASVLCCTRLESLACPRLALDIRERSAALSLALALMDRIEITEIRTAVLPWYFRELAGALFLSLELAYDLVAAQSKAQPLIASTTCKSDDAAWNDLLHRSRQSACERACDQNFLLLLQAHISVKQERLDYLTSLRMLLSISAPRGGKSSSRAIRRKRLRLLECYLAIQNGLLEKERNLQ